MNANKPAWAVPQGNGIRLSHEARARMTTGTLSPQFAAQLALDLWNACKALDGHGRELVAPCVDVTADVVSGPSSSVAPTAQAVGRGLRRQCTGCAAWCNTEICNDCAACAQDLAPDPAVVTDTPD